jgi:glucose/galactose transporter
MEDRKNNYIIPIIIIGFFFFIFGFVTWLNGVLIPYLKIACELNNFESYFVAFAFYISYFVMALPSSWVLKKTGFKRGMAVGLIVMALGTALFIPAAYTRTYGLFLAGLFVMGTGLAILQTASNPYITILGPIESAAKRISIMGIANKGAGVISPLILGAIVLKDTDIIVEKIKLLNPVQKALELDDLALRVVVPYLIMTLILLGLAALIKYTNLPEIDQEEEVTNTEGERTSIFKYPYLIFGVIALFLYVGVEVLAGDTIISYGLSQNIPMQDAKVFTSYTLAAMLLGYILGIIMIPKIIKQEQALMGSAILGILFTILAIFTDGFTSIVFIAALGFANAIMWPAIWPLSIDGIGKFIKTGSALLIMGIAGGAMLPLLYGYLSDIESIGTTQSYWIMVPCYLFILFFAVSGHKMGKRIKKTNA